MCICGNYVILICPAWKYWFFCMWKKMCNLDNNISETFSYLSFPLYKTYLQGSNRAHHTISPKSVEHTRTVIKLVNLLWICMQNLIILRNKGIANNLRTCSVGSIFTLTCHICINTMTSNNHTLIYWKEIIFCSNTRTTNNHKFIYQK